MTAQQTSSSNKVARILIVDDHPIVRRGLAQLISQEPDLEVCGEAADIADAVEEVRAKSPDLAVIDISLKSGSGIELIKQIKSMNSAVKLLVSSMYDESLYAERALRAGAMGYINKEQALDNIIDAIRQVLRGRVYLSRDMTNQMLQRSVRGEQVDRPLIDALSSRELEVFELIGRGLSTSQIAHRLHRSVKTIETHRENIKVKLNLSSGSQLTCRAVQWVLENS